MAAQTPEISLDEEAAPLKTKLLEAAHRAVADDRMTWLLVDGERVAAIISTYAGAALGDAEPGRERWRSPLPKRSPRRKA